MCTYMFIHAHMHMNINKYTCIVSIQITSKKALNGPKIKEITGRKKEVIQQ